MVAFFYLIFWTTFAPLVLFLQILLENLFKVFFANSQRYMNKISRSIFQDLKFSPPISNAFPLTLPKLPLNQMLLLVFKRVLPIFVNTKLSKIKYVYIPI
jgi:hypothetical protein